MKSIKKKKKKEKQTIMDARMNNNRKGGKEYRIVITSVGGVAWYNLACKLLYA